MKRRGNYAIRIVWLGVIISGFLSIASVCSAAACVWTRKADMPTPRWTHTSAVVNGRIYIIGGLTTQPPATALSTVEEYDPVANTWTRKADMPTGLYGLCANVVNGKIYTVGGRPGLYAGPYVYQYDPATDTWTPKSNMLLGTSQMASVVMDDKIIVIGGWSISTVFPYTTVQLYDPETDIWTEEADVPFLRATFSADVVNNRIYAIGGTDRPHPCLAASTVYEFGPLPPDFDGSGTVDIKDLVLLIERWGQDEPSCDIAPLPFGDGKVDEQDLKVLMSYWGQEVNDPTLIAHWKLDETSGMIAGDSVGTNNGTLVGNPTWQPTGGKIGGALQFDGVDDCVTMGFVRDPSEGPFSIFAWVKGGAPGQVIVSQIKGANWLMAGASDGGLATELKGAGRTGKTLESAASVTDGAWHRVGFVWDGSNRALYVDDVEVARDTQTTLVGTYTGLHVGAGSTLVPGSFWSGLIDDVRIYNRAVIP